MTCLTTLSRCLTIGLCAAYFNLAACERGSDQTKKGPDTKAGAHDDHDHGDHDHDHDHEGEGHDHDHDHAGHDDHGAPIALGLASAGGFEVSASRDEGAFSAGGEAPVDVTITPAEGSAAKVAAVRFWIGTENAAGSMKAKAAIENTAEPNRWHTHVEIPDPIPAGSQLWVEIESDAGEKTVVSFDLKM
jgi:hypothetical protein